MLFFCQEKDFLHIGFKKGLYSYPFFDELLKFIKRMWEHPINNNLKYEMIYARPTNERNMFCYVFFQKKKS